MVDTSVCKVGIHQLTNEQFNYLHNVLRTKTNEIVYPFDGNGIEVKAKYIQKNKNTAYIEVIGMSEFRGTDAKLQIHIGQGITSRSRLDYAVEKMTETGVASISPIINFGTSNDDKFGSFQDRWLRVAQAATAQCGRMIMPRINHASSVDDWLNDLPKNIVKILFSPIAGNKLSTILNNIKIENDIAVLIGRRSGLTADEEKYLIDKLGFIPVSLGERILRTETVGVVATSIILASTNEY